MVEQISKNKDIVIICKHGIFRSRHLYYLMKREGYENVDYGGVSLWSWRRATIEMLKSANVIISVHPYTTTLLERKYQQESHQQVIQLYVPDIMLNRGVRKVNKDLEEQIQAYLSE